LPDGRVIVGGERVFDGPVFDTTPEGELLLNGDRFGGEDTIGDAYWPA